MPDTMTPGPTDELLAFEDVWLSYGRETLLKGLSFRVHTGEALVLVTLTGGGKSTILRMVAGITRPTRGQVMVRRKSLRLLTFEEHQAYLARTGFVFQNSALLINNSIFDNIALPLRYHRPDFTEAEIERRVMECMDVMGIRAMREQFPATLSTGDRRLANFARAFVTEPDFLVMDDPFVGIPAGVARRTVATLRRLKVERRVTFLIATETITHLAGLADRIGVLRGGELVRSGRVRDFLPQGGASAQRRAPGDAPAGLVEGGS